MADDIKTPKTLMRNDLTASYLRSILDYDQVTGIFTWKETRFRTRAGDIAGHTQADGYVTIRIDDRAYYGHRLAWTHVHGYWPKSRIDHKDGNPSNNQIENLREATQAQNMANALKQKNNKSGVRGVCFDTSRNRWLAFISKKHIGHFDTFEGAVNARKEAENNLHPEFRRA